MCPKENYLHFKFLTKPGLKMNHLLLQLLLPWEVLLDGSSLWRVESYCGKSPVFLLSLFFFSSRTNTWFNFQWGMVIVPDYWQIKKKKSEQKTKEKAVCISQTRFSLTVSVMQIDLNIQTTKPRITFVPYFYFIFISSFSIKVNRATVCKDKLCYDCAAAA